MIKENPAVIWIEDNFSLDKAVARWSKATYLAMDTEFERRTTYYPILALLQVYDGDSIYLIDPLKVSCGDKLRKIFADPLIVKIFHAGKEDLEVLYFSWNCQLAGFFDTQVAYAFDSGTNSIGYANLVNELCGVQLDKDATQSNWLARPLSAEQLDYAAKDVLYLPSFFKILSDRLLNKPAANFFAQECQEMCSYVLKVADFEQDYRDAKEVCRLNSQQLALFKTLYQWREETAIKDNRTRNHIAKDGLLVTIAGNKPESKRALQNINGLHPRTIRHYGDQIVQLITEFETSQNSLPTPVANPRDVKDLNRLSDAFLKAVEKQAQQLGIETSILASKRLVRKVALGYLEKEPFPSVWNGWRGDLLKPHFDAIFSHLIATQISES